MSKFWDFANIIDEKLYLTVVLISISLMKEVEHFFMSKSNLHVFFYELFIYSSSDIFIGFLVFFFSTFRGSLYINCKYFFLAYHLCGFLKN